VVDLAVREHRDARVGDGEVAEELRRVLDLERLRRLLALDEDLHLAVAHDRVVDLLALLEAEVRRELGDHLERVEDVVSEDRGDERHDERVLRRLLRLDGLALIARRSGR
jgi:hypothetical protein